MEANARTTPGPLPAPLTASEALRWAVAVLGDHDGGDEHDATLNALASKLEAMLGRMETGDPSTIAEVRSLLAAADAPVAPVLVTAQLGTAYPSVWVPDGL